MKISKEEKKKVRRKIIRAAVKIINELGIKKATMRKIAKEAGIGEATIYKYFSCKEKIFFGYFEQTMGDVIDSLKNIDEFEDYLLQEKLQIFIENILESYALDRAFVENGVDLIYRTPFSSYSEMLAFRRKFTGTINQFIEEAIESEEIPIPPFQSFIPNLFGDYFIGILIYWLKDESEDYTETTQLIDMSLNLIITVFKSGILSKFMDLATFFLRQHLVGWADNIGSFQKLILKTSGFREKEE